MLEKNKPYTVCSTGLVLTSTTPFRTVLIEAPDRRATSACPPRPRDTAMVPRKHLYCLSFSIDFMQAICAFRILTRCYGLTFLHCKNTTISCTVSHIFNLKYVFCCVHTHTTEDVKERKFVRENYAIKILVIFVQLLFGQVRQNFSLKQ